VGVLAQREAATTIESGDARYSAERDLVLRAATGDHDAFTLLVDARLVPTFRTILAILGDETEARDATQLVFVRAWQHLPSLRDPVTFPAWFHRIVVNTARSTMRGRRRRVVREVTLDSLEHRGLDRPMAGSSVERVSELDRLERALDRLSPDERALLWLHHYEELSLREIGDRLGIRSGTVKSRLFSARRALEKALAREDA
jgi:RNA polymerase sigma-70 factor (ECF subfamily)